MSTKKYNNPILHQPTRSLPSEVGVIGAGTIGPDIGYYLKSAIMDLILVLIDIDHAALAKAEARIEAYVNKGLARGKLSEDQANAVRKNIITSTDYAALANCDWVIEAATENLAIKKQIFSQAEAQIRSDALITSNTSSLPAERLFSHLKYPERATVTHFFAPAFMNPAVEVINWRTLSDSNFVYLRWLFCVTGKTPMVTSDDVCFMLDRIFDNWCNESGMLLDSATPAQIDQVAREFVHAGPFYVLNLANGNPIIVETNTLQMEEGEHYRPAEVFERTEPWNTLAPNETIEVEATLCQAIRDRLLGILWSQSFEILDREIGDAADLELGSRLAFAFKEGPLELARRFGTRDTTRVLKRLAEERPGMPMPQSALESYQNFRRHILLDFVNGVGVITLRRPDALHALHDEMTDEILAVLKQYENDSEVSGFVITGYGNQAFCSGADIGKFPEMLGDHQQCVEYARACSRLLVYLDQYEKVVVAALNGLALGGGLELAMRCHYLVATPNAFLQFPEIGLGIVPGIGAMVVPYRRWPAAAATFNNMLLKAEKLTAQNAKELGVIEQLVDTHANLLPTAIKLVQEHTGSLPRIDENSIKLNVMPETSAEPISAAGELLSNEVSTILQRAIIDAASMDSLADALQRGYDAFAQSGATDAAAEGLAAFSGRRKADFKKTG